MKVFRLLFWTFPLVLAAGCLEPGYYGETTRSGYIVGSEPQYYDTDQHYRSQAQYRTGREWLPPTGRIAPHAAPHYETRHYAERPTVIVQRGMRGESSRSDRALAQRIRRGFETSHDLSGSLRHITVSIQDGRVVVNGVAHSESEARAVIREIRRTPGVVSVKDRLKINRNRQ